MSIEIMYTYIPPRYCYIYIFFYFVIIKKLSNDVRRANDTNTLYETTLNLINCRYWNPYSAKLSLIAFTSLKCCGYLYKTGSNSSVISLLINLYEVFYYPKVIFAMFNCYGGDNKKRFPFFLGVVSLDLCNYRWIIVRRGKYITK